MDTNIFIGIAVLFGSVILNVGALLAALKVLVWVFEIEDRETRDYYRAKFKRDNNI